MAAEVKAVLWKEESSLGRFALYKRVAANSANQLVAVVGEATYSLTIGEHVFFSLKNAIAAGL